MSGCYCCCCYCCCLTDDSAGGTRRRRRRRRRRAPTAQECVSLSVRCLNNIGTHRTASLCRVRSCMRVGVSRSRLSAHHSHCPEFWSTTVVVDTRLTEHFEGHTRCPHPNKDRLCDEAEMRLSPSLDECTRPRRVGVDHDIPA